MTGNRIAIDTKYGGKVTLFDVLDDQMLFERLEKIYVPEVKVYDSGNLKNIFMRKDYVLGDAQGTRLIKFIYFDPKGNNRTSRDESFIQMAPNGKGFLVRMSIPRSNFTSSALTLDYLIDINSIAYTFDSLISVNGNNIIKDELIHFNNINFSDYPHISFPSELREFSLHKDYFFEEYF